MGAVFYGIWGIFREKGSIFRDGHIEVFIKFRTGNTCERAAQRPETVQVLRPEHPAHGGVMLSTVQCVGLLRHAPEKALQG
jgi:hypothetical protein